jgi:CheY-like chemotaxis protein
MEESVGDLVSLVGMRVLLVDDDLDNREIFCALLRAAGAEVSSVEGAAEALGALGEFQADVVVSDLAMPDRDGFWLLERLNDLPTRGAMAVIVLSAHAEAAVEERATAAGFEAFLRKPVEPGHLVHTLRRVVEQARARRA